MSIEVFVHNRNVDQALKFLKRRMMREGVFLTLQHHKFYVKPGDKIRLKRARAATRRRKSLKRLKRMMLAGEAR